MFIYMSKRIVHLIGNGPTKECFKNDPKGDVYGCNFNTPGINVKAVFIHDRRPLMHLINSNLSFHDAVHGTTDRMILRNFYIRIADICKKKKLIDECTVIPLPKKIREYSSGHDGLMYLLYLAPEPYDELHMWGFDSLVNGKVDSDSKGKIRGSSPQQHKVPRWNERFKKIFHESRKRGKSIFLHCDENTTKKVA